MIRILLVSTQLLSYGSLEMMWHSIYSTNVQLTYSASCLWITPTLCLGSSVVKWNSCEGKTIRCVFIKLHTPSTTLIPNDHFWCCFTIRKCWDHYLFRKLWPLFCECKFSSMSNSKNSKCPVPSILQCDGHCDLWSIFVPTHWKAIYLLRVIHTCHYLT